MAARPAHTPALVARIATPHASLARRARRANGLVHRTRRRVARAPLGHMQQRRAATSVCCVMAASTSPRPTPSPASLAGPARCAPLVHQRRCLALKAGTPTPQISRQRRSACLVLPTTAAPLGLSHPFRVSRAVTPLTPSPGNVSVVPKAATEGGWSLTCHRWHPPRRFHRRLLWHPCRRHPHVRPHCSLDAVWETRLRNLLCLTRMSAPSYTKLPRNFCTEVGAIAASARHQLCHHQHHHHRHH